MTQKIYIASPYTGNEEANVMVQHKAFFELFMLGYMPFAPLLSHYQHEHFPMGYDEWIAYDLQWLASCDALLRLPGDSKGADLEVAEAKRLEIPVFMGWDDFKIVNESWAEGREIHPNFKAHALACARLAEAEES